VPDEDLPSLMKKTYIFMMPSFYEGFGLPIIEAMACGVPVITSNFASMKEVAGDSALLVDPRNIEMISQAISRLTDDIQLRNTLIRKGLDRAKKFSWLNCAQETLKLIDSLK
jgi:glycosyltransferase involved in cell wall biosynthesis